MRKSFTVLSGIFIVSLTIWLTTTCRKEEFVIVYSKVSTIRAYNATSTTIKVEGSIDSLTSAAHDEYGFCLDTLSAPTVYKQKILASGTVQLGTFGGTITGLKPSKTYYLRAFIKDNKKYIYGNEISFSTTAAVVPTVSTNTVDNIKATTASCGGNVTAEGDKPVIAKGICYDTVANPTITKNRTFDGWGTGSFSSQLVNMVPNKTYYARAYAISEFGIGYGSQNTFTTKKALYSFHEDFSNNSNEWYVGTEEFGNASLSDGKYILAYNQSGYLWEVYNNFPDFKAVEAKDFEINTKLVIESFGLVGPGTSMDGGLIWNTDNAHFSFFIARKSVLSAIPSITYSYKYQIGSYAGSYTIWKDNTSFTGTDTIKLSIKKANSKYYFFINDVQVYSHTYSAIAYDGIGFYISNAKIKSDYLYIDQKDYKKTSLPEIIELKSLPGGQSIFRTFRNN